MAGIKRTLAGIVLTLAGFLSLGETAREMRNSINYSISPPCSELVRQKENILNKRKEIIGKDLVIICNFESTRQEDVEKIANNPQAIRAYFDSRGRFYSDFYEKYGRSEINQINEEINRGGLEFQPVLEYSYNHFGDALIGAGALVISSILFSAGGILLMQSGYHSRKKLQV